MKKILLPIAVLFITNYLFAQQMVVQKTDGSNLFLDLNSIEMINFIIPCPGLPTVDYAGKTYNTVLIGNQCWFKENLDVGTQINVLQWASNNSIIEKYCYDDLPSNCETYGALYLWDEAMQYVTNEGAQGICPNGWHMPSEAEVQTLVNYVGNDGNDYKNEDQGSGVGLGTNVSGFAALLNGGRSQYGGAYDGLGTRARIFIGKSTMCGSGFNRYACLYTIEFDATTSNVYFGAGAMYSWGMGVRCIKDN